jgi:hypothetical protein
MKEEDLVEIIESAKILDCCQICVPRLRRSFRAEQTCRRHSRVLTEQPSPAMESRSYRIACRPYKAEYWHVYRGVLLAYIKSDAAR